VATDTPGPSSAPSAASGDAASQATAAASPSLPPAGLAKIVATIFGKEVAGYAALLVFSLATITGSMYVLASRESDAAIRATAKFAGGEFSTEARADFTADTGVRTVIVQFDNGIATSLRDTFTVLAGSIRAVSSNLIDEARREDAARALAQAARSSTFGLSADTQVAAAAPVLSAAAVQTAVSGSGPPAATAVPTQVPTLVPTLVPTAPPAATIQPTNPPAPTSQPTQAVALTQTPTQATTTPVPPTATARPTDTPRSSDGGGEGQTTTNQPTTNQPVAPVVPVVPVAPVTQVQATSVPAVAATSVPATAVPATPVPPTPIPPTPIGANIPLAVTFSGNTISTPGCVNCIATLVTGVGNLSVGDSTSRDITITNSSGLTFSLYFWTECPSCGTNNGLWDDGGTGATGLQVTLTRMWDTRVQYDGPVKIDVGNKVWLDDFTPNQTTVVRVAFTMPVHSSDAISNTMQGKRAPITLNFPFADNGVR
jgi:hypothetical protein